MYSFYINTILKDYLPTDAKNTLLRILKNNNINDNRIYILNNLERILVQNLDSSRSATGDIIGYHPFLYRKVLNAFDSEVRQMLIDIGSMLDEGTYKSGLTSCHDQSFMEIYELCLANGLNCEIGSCDAFLVDNYGHSEHGKVSLLRITEGKSLCEIYKANENQLHITRYIYKNKDASTFKKIKWFTKILDILFEKVPVISGSAATWNVKTIEMGREGDWRFKLKRSVFGITMNKLFLFWLRCGGLPMVLFGHSESLVYFLREDEALKTLKDYKESHAGEVSPYFYASHLGIYSKNTLSKLQ